ncbi:OLC1v1033396C2 [Oldenlandia corymbosa var. corymbosa]|nr:OLC1v1033396C2 [Oldenlandia corymbosa var. corymbosa]
MRKKSVLNTFKKSSNEDGRPSSMVFKKANTVIPAHIVAEAISTLHGLDLRWSGPITPSEMQYVEQYVLAKYPEYSSALVEGSDKTDLYDLCIKEVSEVLSPDGMKKSSPKNGSSTPSFGSNNLPADIDKIQLEPSRLLDILNKKSSFLGSFISIPEIQARNKVLNHCGLPEEDYLVLFTQHYKDAMMLVGESYPFVRGNVYLSIIGEESDYVREFALFKGSKVISAPETWLDLRIKGSQLSQYFRRKCKISPKGLFSYPAEVNGMKYSMHWVSEAHRNSWHVLLDATALVVGKDRLNLALHRPDFVLCSIENSHSHPHPNSKITALLVRRKSFDVTNNS